MPIVVIQASSIEPRNHDERPRPPGRHRAGSPTPSTDNSSPTPTGPPDHTLKGVWEADFTGIPVTMGGLHPVVAVGFELEN